MYLRYGSYLHALCEAGFIISRTPTFTPANVQKSIIERWNINGILQADDQATLMVAINQLIAAYAVPGQDAVVLLADGTTESSHKLSTRNAMGGVRVVEGPSFPEYEAGSAARSAPIRSLLKLSTCPLLLALGSWSGKRRSHSPVVGNDGVTCRR